MFVDKAGIHIAAGEGGKGLIAFRREPHNSRGGPCGGRGGDGGSVWFEADEGLATLMDFRYNRNYRAPRGAHGGGNNRTGAGGDDIIVRVPAGTVIRDSESGELIADLTAHGQRVLAARGGRGGRGNASFASPTRRAPQEAEDGQPGEQREVELELKLLADVGLVGFPNAGKSTLLSRITAARPKVADYPFTTLTPNLGVVYTGTDSFVVADIPGLIEGAHEGKGLGHEFLRHIERTRVLVFLVDITDEEPLQQYETLLRELRSYSPALAERPRCLVFTKLDIVPPEEARPPVSEVEGVFLVAGVSSVSGLEIDSLIHALAEKVSELKQAEPESETGSGDWHK
ncbi:MAG: GTPase ObgE [Candidatus Glassbacteria bacterium]|nr:GTPase ObgE [Candidatus Glassbacteria bacterium]